MVPGNTFKEQEHDATQDSGLAPFMTVFDASSQKVGGVKESANGYNRSGPTPPPTWTGRSCRCRRVTCCSSRFRLALTFSRGIPDRYAAADTPSASKTQEVVTEALDRHTQRLRQAPLQVATELDVAPARRAESTAF
jgi:hypothetical protein